MYAKINLTALRVQTHNCKHTDTHTHTGPRQSSGPGSGFDGGWPDWHRTRLAGGQGLSRGPGIITCEWLSLSCSSPKRRRWRRAQTSAEREWQRGVGGGLRGLTATEVHVCFGLLLITVRQAAKPLCLRPLHQSNTLVLQRAAVTPDGWCYSLLSSLAALW